MKRIILTLVFVLMLLVSIAPISAKTITPQQATLPIPKGFCIYFSIPIGDVGIIDSFIYNSIWGNIEAIGIFVFFDYQPGDTLEGRLFIPSDTAFDLNSYDTALFDPYLLRVGRQFLSH